MSIDAKGREDCPMIQSRQENPPSRLKDDLFLLTVIIHWQPIFDLSEKSP